ncbi:MAG: VTT domain-containing protein [Bdellovibrionota bacterium]
MRDRIRSFYRWILTWADYRYAWAILSVLAFSEASFMPIPPDVFLIALCLGKPKNSFYYALLCSITSVLGGVVGYGIGMFLWGSVDDVVFRYLFSRESFEHVGRLYNANAFWATFIAGYTPIPYKVFTLSAGAFGVSFWGFFWGSVVGRSMRFFLVGGIIYVLGQRAREFLDKYLHQIILASSVAIVCAVIFLRWL